MHLSIRNLFTSIAVIMLGIAFGACASSTAMSPADDEPDQLSWEFFSMNQTLIRDFIEWAKKNPPPSLKTDSLPKSYPYTWIKAGELQTDNAQWKTEKVGQTVVLRGPGGHNFYDKGNVFIDIPQDGNYRMWVRFQHTKGKNESFNLTVYPAAKEDISIPDIESKLTVFEQLFARSFFERYTDPIPDMSTVDTPPGGFFWEGTYKTAFMKKGKYRLHFSSGIYSNHPDIKISDIVFTADPLYTPSDADIPAQAASGEKTPCGELAENWKLYSARPGATSFEAASPSLKSYWNKWKKHLIEKLEKSEFTDYEWGYLASLVYFDEESNLTGRPSEIRKQKELDARPDTTFKIKGSEFKLQNSDPAKKPWAASDFYTKAYGATDNITGPSYPSENTAFYELDIPADGRYVIWVQYYHNGGHQMCPSEISVFSNEVLVKTFETENQPGSSWTDGGGMMLKKGKVKIQLKTAYPKFAGGDKKNSGPCILRCVLTQRVEFKPNREVEYPDGQKVGTGATGFWFSKDPWAGFTRYSAPGSFYYYQYAPVRWEYLPESDINKTDFSFEVMNGEVSSQLFMLRNNTDKPITFTPELKTGNIPSSVRVVSSTLAGGGFWSPMLLMKRSTVTAPPQQNTGLWLTFDCRNIKEGVYTGTFDAAGNKISLKITVKGSLKGAPVPYMFPYTSPYPRQSCWDAFRDLGINMIEFCNITKADMKEYGILNQVGIRAGADSEENIRKGIGMAEKLGLAPGDYCWYLIDEPGASKYPQWLAMAKNIRKVDPNQLIWCNLGGWAPEKKSLPLLLEMMDYWDVSCPYHIQFGVNAKDKEYDAYVEKLNRVGKIRLLYETPDIGDTEKLLWAPKAIIEVGERAMKNNRNGWAFFSLRYGPPYDDIYINNRDYAVSIYPGSNGATIHTRNSEAIRESIQRWKKAKLEEKKDR